jgi:hypothetical protein
MRLRFWMILTPCFFAISYLSPIISFAGTNTEPTTNAGTGDLIQSIWNLRGGRASANSEIQAFVSGIRSQVAAGQLPESWFRVQNYYIQRSTEPAINDNDAAFLKEMGTLSQEKLEQIEKMLVGPVGEAYRNSLEELLDQRKMQMQVARKLPKLLADQERVLAVAELVEKHFGPALETQWELLLLAGSYGAKSVAMISKNESLSFSEEEAIIENLEEQRPNILLMLNQQAIQSTVYGLRDLSVKEIQDYGLFLDTEAGKFFNDLIYRLSADVIKAVLNAGYQAMENSMLSDSDNSNDATGFVLKNTQVNKCVDLPESRAFYGLNLQQWDCDGTNAQAFTVVGDELRHAHTRNCFEILEENWSGKKKSYAVQSGCTNDTGEIGPILLRPSSKDPADFFIQNTAGSLCLTVVGDRDSNGDPLRFTKCKRSKSQKFQRVGSDI